MTTHEEIDLSFAFLAPGQEPSGVPIKAPLSKKGFLEESFKTRLKHISSGVGLLAALVFAGTLNFGLGSYLYDKYDAFRQDQDMRVSTWDMSQKAFWKSSVYPVLDDALFAVSPDNKLIKAKADQLSQLRGTGKETLKSSSIGVSDALRVR